MRILILPIFVILMAVLRVADAAATIPSVDGVKLGNTSEDVLRRLHRRRIKAITIHRPCLADYLSAHRRVMPLEDRNGHCIEQISWRHAGDAFIDSFTEDVPRRPGISVVTEISLNTDVGFSPALDDVLREAGRPSLTDGLNPWVVAVWCFSSTCHDLNRVVGDPRSPPTLLVHRGAGFTLDDNRGAAERSDFADSVLRAHGVVLEP